jgi:hypothetical protein
MVIKVVEKGKKWTEFCWFQCIAGLQITVTLLYGRKTLIDDMAMVHWYFGEAWPHIIVLFLLLMLPG